jgi:ATP-dependent RNA helicase DDX10/DBP4
MSKQKGKQRSERFSDVERLIQRIESETPPSGEYLYDYKLEQAKT